MAQLRRYPNVLPSFLGSHNVNGNSERVEQRENARIARVQTSDMETNKSPSGHLFPPPRKVSDPSDEITKTIKNALGEYTIFKTIMHQDVSREKTPGQSCVGVMPVPATPTESKSISFPPTTTKTKVKDKVNHLNHEKHKGNASVDQKAKLEQKHKPSSDSSRHKALKLGEKLNDKKESKVVNKISFEKYKSNHASVGGEKSNALPLNKPKGEKDDESTNNKNQDLDKEAEMNVKKEEETSENLHQETTRMEKPKLPPLELPGRNAGSSLSLPQSPRDMKLQNILKEMTESVNMPLTGICTPLPKQDSRFPFPSNINEKENSQVSSDPTNSFIKDFDISDDEEDSDEERENDDDHSQRPAGQTRSRTSSSSSSSSSGESSDSEGEEADNVKTTPRTSMLNSPPAAPVKIPSPVQSVTTPPKHDSNDNLGKNMNETSQTQTSSKSTSDRTLGKPRTSSKSDDSISIGKSEEKSPCKESKSSSDKLQEQINETKSAENVKGTLVSAGQKHTHSLNRTKSESKDILPDTKVRIKLEPGVNDSLKVKSADSKGKSESKKRSESESKQVGEVKSTAERTKTAEKSSESNSKSSSKLGVKQKKIINGVVKKSQEEKVEKLKRNDKLDQKKTKRKHSTGEPGKQPKDKTNLHPSKEKTNGSHSKDKAEVQPTKEKTDELALKDTNRTKSGNKEKKKASRAQSFGFDCAENEEEDSVIDVVGDDSPVAKKKKGDSSEKTNGLNGVHKNGHVDMPLGIQLVHDKDKDPTSLIVKIPLSFLKRIPSKFAENVSVESSQTGFLENDGKISKDCSGKKNGENDHMEMECTEEVEKNQKPSNHGKRSPSWDSGQQPKKRVRHDSQRDKFEHKKRKTTAELNAECEADIRKAEPDAHLLQAKTLKREADKLTDKEAKSRTYVEAIVRFICCGKALEDKDDGELRAGQMYSETTELLRFILKHVLGKTEDKRLLILCLRIQSLLLHKLYRMKGKQAVRNTQTLAEHFKATNKNNMTSPYTSSSTTSNKHGSTPSPMSPTPSPAGSVGSIGSNGSNSSGEGNHSQNGRHASTASVTSPVSVSVPQKIHSMMAQHVSNTSKLVNSIDMWDRADSLTSDYHEYFTTVDSICGALTFHSSIPHIVSYVNNCLSTLHEHGKGT